jgi:hypothetical protein
LEGEALQRLAIGAANSMYSAICCSKDDV